MFKISTLIVLSLASSFLFVDQYTALLKQDDNVGEIEQDKNDLANEEQDKNDLANEEQDKNDLANEEQDKNDLANEEQGKNDLANEEQDKNDLANEEQEVGQQVEELDRAKYDPIVYDAAVAEYPKADQEFPDVSPNNQYNFVRIFAGLYYQNSYRHINNFLVENVEDRARNVTANMKAAIEWYNKERRNTWNIFNRHLVGALEQFTSLNRILNGEKCTRNSYAILLKNDRATGGKTHKTRSKLGPFYRIERVIYQIAIGHAIECKNKYPLIFEKKYGQLDKDAIEKVEAFTNDIFNQLMRVNKCFFRQTKKFESLEKLQHVKTISGKKEAQIAYDALKLFARHDDDVIYLKKVFDEKDAVMKVNRVKLVDLFKKYLVEPCAYYVRELGPDIFIPAAYDIRMLDKEDRYEQNDDNSKFFSCWTRYKVCNLLIGKDQKSLIKSLVKIAKKA